MSILIRSREMPQGKLEKRNLRSRGKRSAWMREFIFENLPQASSRAGIYKAGREIFSQLWAWLAQEYFVYFKPAKCADAEKDPLRCPRQARKEKFSQQGERFFHGCGLGHRRNTLCISRGPSAQPGKKIRLDA